jgi:hypothetical protein
LQEGGQLADFDRDAESISPDELLEIDCEVSSPPRSAG